MFPGLGFELVRLSKKVNSVMRICAFCTSGSLNTTPIVVSPRYATSGTSVRYWIATPFSRIFRKLGPRRAEIFGL